MTFTRWWWLALLVLGFGIPEAVAIARHRIGDTFSASWQTWLGTFTNPRHRWARRAVFTAFFGALYVHFTFGVHAWPWLIVPGAGMAAVAALSMLRGER